ncbi:glycosyltransferase [Actinoplanes utahensis]|uniref:glycosyltransferase n=1 Tax=Actinoplanes utahensis TaxID=1869 RepID=UPI0009FCB68A|nr:galactosyltransferase-related protein [Actinoplanes utahensis]
MTLLKPSNPDTLASAVVDSLVVAADPQAPESSIFYWDRGAPYTRAVVAAAREVDDPRLHDLAAAVLADTRDPRAYAALHGALAAVAPAPPTDRIRNLFTRGWEAESNSRLGCHLGARYGRDPVPRWRSYAELSALRPGPAQAAPERAEVLVVIPFRDRTPDRARLRNLLACLIALRDQSAPRETYRVMVVEEDSEPRCRAVIEPYTDDYLWIRKDGLFNKSWAVNAGVMNAPFEPGVICILDADVLADHEFVARNARRFTRPGTMGHLSYRDMWCLDADATAWAVEQRLAHGSGRVDPARLRAFVLRSPPGCCVWVRRSAFLRIGGMDERFEGWGGEDNDFAYRMDINAAFQRYDDPLLHMYHPSSALLRADGELINAHIPALSWKPGSPIGDPERFAGGSSAPAYDGEVRPATMPSHRDTGKAGSTA